MTVQSIAIFLLVIRLISLSLLLSVLFRQVSLLRLSSSHKIAGLRVQMLALGVVFVLGHILPILTDLYYGFIKQGGGEINLIVYYAISNSVAALAASVLLWKIYNESGKQTEKQQSKSINIDEIPKK